MRADEARALLAVDETADVRAVRQRYEEMYSEYMLRLTNAPTPALRETYQRNIRELEQAARLLTGGAADAGPSDLPASEPVLEDRVGPPRVPKPPEVGRPTPPRERTVTPPLDQRPPAPVRATRPCPFCAEEILVQARVCKHCDRDVSREAMKAPPPVPPGPVEPPRKEHRLPPPPVVPPAPPVTPITPATVSIAPTGRAHAGWWVLGLIARIVGGALGLVGVLFVLGLVLQAKKGLGAETRVTMGITTAWQFALAALFWWMGGRAFRRARLGGGG